MPTRGARRPVQPPGDEKPDPIVSALTRGAADPEPSADTVQKGRTAGEASTGTPVAGRSGIDAATKGGPFGVLQILGPGLITGASDDDPSGIDTYSQVGSISSLTMGRSLEQFANSCGASVWHSTAAASIHSR